MLDSSSAPRSFVHAGLLLTVIPLLPACGNTAGDARPAAEAAPPDPSSWEVVLTPQAVELDDPANSIFVALSAVDADTVWIAGADDDGARYAWTVDGGGRWASGTVPGTEGLEFRDVHAFDGSTVLLASIGSGPASRIYRTEDAGSTWTETFRMDHPEGFIDCMDFWDDERGILYGDAVDGGLWVATTSDGGRTWHRTPPDRLPEPVGAEGGAATSGTCVDVGGTGEAWIATSGGRILVTADAGRSWSSVPAPLEASTSVAVRADGLGYAVRQSRQDVVKTAITRDGGRSWQASGELSLPWGAFTVAWLPDPTVSVLFASGPSGMAWSTDAGANWTTLSTENRWGVGFGSSRVGWAVGVPGNVIRIDVVDGAGR